jgi:hypothetical protein
VIIVMWAACVFATGWVASTTRVGPVVYTFTKQRGVHLADVGLALLVLAVASAITWLALRPPRHRRDDEVEVVAVELRRAPAIIAMWIAAVVASVLVTFETEVGPVLFVYNQHRRVRLGDLVVSFVIVVVAGWATTRLLRPDPEPGAPEPG